MQLELYSFSARPGPKKVMLYPETLQKGTNKFANINESMD
jgi:hypothetical protein